MKKISTVAVKQRRNCSEQKLTIGFDLGDRSSWYCVLDEAGSVLLEQRVSTTPKAMKEVFGGMPRSRIALETGMHSPWGKSAVERVGTRSDRGACAQRALDRRKSVRCTRGCTHSTTRFPPATAPVRFAVPGSAPLLSPDSYCARCTRAAVPRSSWPVRAPCSPAPSALAPVRLALGSRSDPLALSRGAPSPDTATGDRSWPAAPGSARPADRPSFDFRRSSARCAHAPRSLRVPTRSTADLPTANACPFPTRSGYAASPRTLPSSPSESCSLVAPAARSQLHPARNPNSNDRPDRNRSSASARNNSYSASLLRC